MVKRAKPKVSKTNHALSNFFRYFEKTIVKKRAAKEQVIYMGVVIQKGVIPSITSRTVPPPMATAKPQTNPPNQSYCFDAACLIPDMAKAKVPITSII